MAAPARDGLELVRKMWCEPVILEMVNSTLVSAPAADRSQLADLVHDIKEFGSVFFVCFVFVACDARWTIYSSIPRKTAVLRFKFFSQNKRTFEPDTVHRGHVIISRFQTHVDTSTSTHFYFHTLPHTVAVVVSSPISLSPSCAPNVGEEQPALGVSELW